MADIHIPSLPPKVLCDFKECYVFGNCKIFWFLLLPNLANLVSGLVAHMGHAKWQQVTFVIVAEELGLPGKPGTEIRYVSW